MIKIIRYTHHVALNLCQDGDDSALGTIWLDITCDIRLGDPPTGYGENYDPGTGDDVTLLYATATKSRLEGLTLDAGVLSREWLAMPGSEDAVVDAAVEEMAE